MIAKKIERIPLIGTLFLFLTKWARLYLIYKPALFFNQLRNPANIFQLEYVNPEQIETYSKGKFSRINKRLDIGKVKDGNWDRGGRKFKETEVYRGFYERFVDRKAWQDTIHYKYVVDKIEKEGRSNASNNEEEFIRRLETLDELYLNIQKHGFLSDPKTKVDTYRHKSLLFRKAKELENFLDFIMVDIGRDGEYLFVSGRHRLAIALILGLEKVPVLIRVRHKKWVEKEAAKDSNH